ncbi:MAG: ribonuclease R [Planctomycetaceae bacterium]
MVKDVKQRILAFVSRASYRPLKERQLARRLGVSVAERDAFSQAIRELRQSGRLSVGHRGQLRCHSLRNTITGIVRRVSNGCGFVPSPAQDQDQNPQDIFIAAEQMSHAFDGDKVIIEVLRRRRSGGQRCGRVIDVIERATTTFVGTFLKSNGQGFVQIDGRKWAAPVPVSDSGATQARESDKVVVEILRFPSVDSDAEGVIQEVLGRPGDDGVDLQIIIHEFGLPHEFADDVLREARSQADAFDPDDRLGRVDLSSECTVTIDPVDARDFDDAISLSRSDDGHWHLGVHIADVAHFVPEGGALDREARRRGTSVYLPRCVLPMLPELISNGLASLQQDKPRFTKSVMIELTADGAVVDTRCSNSVVQVTQRLNYGQVMPLIEGTAPLPETIDDRVPCLLRQMHELASILNRRRVDRGGLELHIPEVQLEFDKRGRVTGATQRVQDQSHRIVEEFMLAANTAVATTLHEIGLKCLRRIHASPTRAKMKSFAEFCHSLDLKLKRFQSRGALQKLLAQVANTELERAVNYALLRSFQQAEYASAEEGHYALALENYCHFTSPIRRYPDLTIHRVLDQVIRGKNPRGHSETRLLQLGKTCSFTERRAERAERELTRIRMLQFMTGMIDEEIEVFITGVERFGVFCQGVEIPADGLLPRDGLDDDHYDLDERACCYTGRRSGRVLQLGGPLRVVVKTVDVARRTLEFALPRVDSDRANRGIGNDNSSRGTPRAPQVAAGKHRHKSRAHKKKRRST